MLFDVFDACIQWFKIGCKNKGGNYNNMNPKEKLIN